MNSYFGPASSNLHCAGLQVHVSRLVGLVAHKQNARLRISNTRLHSDLQMPPVPLIVDTDLSIDVDDVGALCAAHALADVGEVRLRMVASQA